MCAKVVLFWCYKLNGAFVSLVAEMYRVVLCGSVVCHKLARTCKIHTSFLVMAMAVITKSTVNNCGRFLFPAGNS